MTVQAPGATGIQFSISDSEVTAQVTVRTNLNQQIIVIFENTLRLIILAHLGAIAERREWIPPLGVFVTIAITLPTVQFRDFLGLSEDFWRAFFVLSLLLSGAWLFIKARKARRTPTVEALFAEILQSSVPSSRRAPERAVESDLYDHPPYGGAV